jgi:hypothetical protein
VSRLRSQDWNKVPQEQRRKLLNCCRVCGSHANANPLDGWLCRGCARWVCLGCKHNEQACIGRMEKARNWKP